MAHYAFLDKNNIVTEVIVGIDETELIEGLDPETWYGNFRGQVCKRTSYNNNIRKIYASIGDTYDPIKDEFVSANPFIPTPQPFPSWTLNSLGNWESPVPVPTEYGPWKWNEDSLSWLVTPLG